MGRVVGLVTGLLVNIDDTWHGRGADVQS